METITRQAVLELLDGDWAQYVVRFQRLPSATQTEFLQQQGYQRLADLLGHIVAWWEVGLQNIQAYRRDPAATQPEVDVDSFNAQAVEQVREVSDAEEMRLFEAARRKFVECVRSLSEADFKDERVLNQLRWELVNHLEEHRIE
jgi:intracellular sulfur oxidation DsrE/DsrF family protein